MTQITTSLPAGSESEILRVWRDADAIPRSPTRGWLTTSSGCCFSNMRRQFRLTNVLLSI
jgi:hypothetical protein